MDGSTEDDPEIQGHGSTETSPAGLIRAFTLRNNAARQVAVNFLPSRQPFGNTMKLRRNNSLDESLLSQLLEETSTPSERQAELIVREMEQNQRLMEDHPEAEDLRREALRYLPQNLTMKRSVRAKLSASVSLRSKRRPLSCWKRLKYRLSFSIKRAKDRFRDFIYTVELWYEDIRKIEGKFGSSVGSYFYFLRWLFVCNFILLVLILAFIVAPQLVHDARVGTEAFVGSEQFSIGVLDFISGGGPYKNSTLFYGRYHSGVVAGSGYSMPFAYFYTMICVYLTFFGVLCYRTAFSYRKNFIETEGGVRHVFANKVFTGWDFGIASQRAATLNARNNYNEFKELLAEQERSMITISFYTKYWNLTVNAVIWAIVVAMIAGFQYGFYILLSLEDARGPPYWDLIVSFFVTLIVSVAPIFFDMIAKLEFYQPRTKLYVTLTRTFLIDASTLILLLVFYRNKSSLCWETSFGQETYRLVILDGVVSLVLYPAFEFTRGVLYRMNPTSTVPEFSIAYNSLTLLYNQALLWYGTMFSPLLVAAVVVKFLLLFYVKRACAMHACVPARRIWRAAQTQTVMYVLVTVSMFVTLFALGSLFIKSSSQSCGPFTEYPAVYTILTEATLNLSAHSVVRSILTLVLRPGAITLFMLLLGTLVYYMHARAQAHRSMVRILRQMLVLEAKDKDFLLCAISKVSNGEWQYSPRDEAPPAPNSHTWKYLHDDNVRKPSNAGFHFDVSRVSQSGANTSRLNQSGLDNSRARNSRPFSHVYERSKSCGGDDGDTDSSFSWKGSHVDISQSNIRNIEDGRKKWI